MVFVYEISQKTQIFFDFSTTKFLKKKLFEFRFLFYSILKFKKIHAEVAAVCRDLKTWKEYIQ